MKGLLTVTSGSRNVLVICISAMFCMVIAAAAAIVRWETDGAVTATLITILFGALATTISSVAGLIKGEAIKQNTDRILNGEMDKKLEIAITKLVPSLVAKEINDLLTSHLGTSSRHHRTKP